MKKLQLILCLCIFCIGLSQAQSDWQQFTNSPSGTDRHDDIFFVDSLQGWSIRSSGHIHNTTDGGATWNQQLLQSGTHFRAVGFFDSNRGFAGNLGAGSFSAATDTNPMYETSDGGASWSVTTGFPAGALGICAIQIVNANTIVAGGRVRGPGAGVNPSPAAGGSYLHISQNQGATWNHIEMTQHGIGGIMDVYFFDNNVGFVIGMEDVPYTTGGGSYRGRIVKTTDGGATWSTVLTTPITGSYFWKIAFPTNSIGYVSLQQNNLPYPNITYYKTTDGGNNWALNTISVSGFFVQGIGFADANTGWISGSSSTTTNMFETTDGGASWNNITYSDSRRINKYRFLSPTLGYAAGTKLHVWRAPEPVQGDEPCNATLINPDGNPISGALTTDYTQTNSVVSPIGRGFSNTGSSATNIWNTANVCEDKWYKVPVPASGGFRLSFTGVGGGNDLAVATYKGSCAGGGPSSFGLLGADDGTTLPEISVSCQIPGDTVYVRLWYWGCGNTSLPSAFTITAEDLNSVEIGDEPNTAISLPVNTPPLPESNFQTFDINANLFETKGTATTPSCGNFEIMSGCEDRWFKITAPVSGNIEFELQNLTDNFFISMALYDDNCPGELNELQCVSNGPLASMSYAATAGNNYYLRVWDYSCNAFPQFDIRAFIPVPATPNCTGGTAADEPCSAPCLAVNQSFVTENIDASQSQTGSGIPDPNTFSNTGSPETSIWNTANGCEDVWYQVEIPASGGFRANFVTLSGSTDLAVAVYTGDCSTMSPVNFEQLGADDGATLPTISASCLVPGSTAYIRIWEFGCNADASFGIFLDDIYSDVPVGDEPVSAVELTIDNPLLTQSLDDSYTETKGAGFPTNCSNGASDGGFEYLEGCEDLWYKVTATSNDFMNFEVDNAAGGSTDLNMAIYDNNCPGELSLIACDNNSGNGNNPLIRYFVSDATEYYVRIWDENCDFTAPIDFGVRAYIDRDPIDIPTCSSKELLFDQTTPVSVISTAQTNAAETFGQIADPTACSNMVNDSWTNSPSIDRVDSWLQVVVPPSGAFALNGVSTGGSGDVELAVYETADGQCGVPTNVIACDGDTGLSESAEITISCRTPGEVLYIRVWDKRTDNDVLLELLATEMIPIGDEPTNPISANSGDEINIDPETFSQSFGSLPSCSGHELANGCQDAWTQVTVPAGGELSIEVINTSESIGLACYTGSCFDDFTEVTCNDGSNNYLDVENLNPGDQVFIRSWDSSCSNNDEPYTLKFNSVLLPVELFDFNVELIDFVSVLSWSTALEENSSHFEVERSTDGNHFEQISNVDAVVNSTQTQFYAYRDESVMSLAASPVYYRLKMVDQDETFDYSSIRSVEIKGSQDELLVYPNPSSGIINIVSPQTQGSIEIFLYSMDGRLVQSLLSDSNTEIIQLDVSRLSKGYYLLKVQNELRSFEEKVFVAN